MYGPGWTGNAAIVSPPLACGPSLGAVCSRGVAGDGSTVVAVVVGGVYDLFLLRPAICGGSVGGSGGGEPDMGGVGREAHAGGATGFGRARSMVNLEPSILDRCFLKDVQRRDN